MTSKRKQREKEEVWYQEREFDDHSSASLFHEYKIKNALKLSNQDKVYSTFAYDEVG